MIPKGFFEGFSGNPGVPESGGHGLRNLGEAAGSQAVVSPPSPLERDCRASTAKIVLRMTVVAMNAA